MLYNEANHLKNAKNAKFPAKIKRKHRNVSRSAQSIVSSPKSRRTRMQWCHMSHWATARLSASTSLRRAPRLFYLPLKQEFGVKQLGPTFRAASASSGHKNRSTIVIRQARRLFNSRLRKSTNLASAKVASTGSETTLRNSSQKKVKIIDARTIRAIFSVLRQSANVISLVDPVIVFFKTKVKMLHMITQVLPM